MYVCSKHSGQSSFMTLRFRTNLALLPRFHSRTQTPDDVAARWVCASSHARTRAKVWMGAREQIIPFFVHKTYCRCGYANWDSDKLCETHLKQTKTNVSWVYALFHSLIQLSVSIEIIKLWKNNTEYTHSIRLGWWSGSIIDLPILCAARQCRQTGQEERVQPADIIIHLKREKSL